MLSYLLLNNELEAAQKLGSKRSFQTQLMQAFNAGESKHFFQIFSLLTPTPKLQFYLHVYFLIYQIHPSLKHHHQIPKQSLKVFKQYIDTKGSQLAKTNEFLQFYALPYIKQPLEHPTFKTLFKKEWVDNLKQKLKVFLKEETKRMQEESTSFSSSKKLQLKDERPDNSKQLSYQLEEYAEKYHNLEAQYRSVIALTNANMLESQNKWFQLLKELVQCSRSLINLVSKHNRELTSERKFLNIRKKVDRFEKFVSQKLEDMISQSQDISIFDRPSMNQISCTIAAVQKSYSHNFPDMNPLMIQEYIPTDFKKVVQSFNKMVGPETKEKNISIVKGLIFRILKSKDAFVRRQHIIGILQSDVLGTRSGYVKNYLFGPLRQCILFLMIYIESDYYGRNTLFTSSLIKQLITILKNQSENKIILEYTVSILHQLSVKESVKLELIDQDIIKFFLSTLRLRLEELNDNVIEQISGTLLNLTSRPEGLDKFEEEEEIFYTLGALLESQNPIVRVVTNGTVYNLLGRRKIYDNAFEVGLHDIISYLIENDRKANLKELRYIEDRLINFTPSTLIARSTLESDDVDDIFDDDAQPEYDDEVVSIEEFLKAHEVLTKEFGLGEKEGLQQSNATRIILDTSLKRLKQRKNLEKIQNESKRFIKVPEESKPVPTANSYMSPRQRGQRESQKVYVQNTQSVHISKYTSVVVDPVTNFSPGSSKIKPRQHIVKKLNEQIKANRKEDQSRRKDHSEEKGRHFSFNEPKQSSMIVQPASKHSKLYEQTPEYQQAFAPKPKLARSPPTSPR